jgi:signal peptidase I
MFFLTPKYLKKGRLYIKEAEKRLAYHRDRWSEDTIITFESAIAKLRKAVKGRHRDGIEACEVELEKLCGEHCPRTGDSWIGENVEVFLVAIIVALGIRTYFLQPFTIPTASMQPTLFGITGRATAETPPNVLKRALDFAWFGRTWHQEIAQADGERVIEIKETKRGGWRKIFTYTRIVTLDPQGVQREYFVNENARTVEEAFFPRTDEAKVFAKGEPIVQGFTDTGDHVFVDKMSYHFRKPKRGEVFVFDTRTLGTIERRNNPRSNTQYYIKRLVGVGGDELRISPPQLFVNGEVATAPGNQRVMQGTYGEPKDGYRGYSNRSGSPDSPQRFLLLGSPSDTFVIPDRKYFAMGDNSYQSSDSRDWGEVPETNLMGTGVFVYWPFSRAAGGRWGIIQ